LKDKELVELIKKDLYQLADDKKFNSLEKPKQFHFSLEPWTVENEMLTPTFKTKRNVAKKRYEAEIAEMYGAGCNIKTN